MATTTSIQLSLNAMIPLLSLIIINQFDNTYYYHQTMDDMATITESDGSPTLDFAWITITNMEFVSYICEHKKITSESEALPIEMSLFISNDTFPSMNEPLTAAIKTNALIDTLTRNNKYIFDNINMFDGLKCGTNMVLETPPNNSYNGTFNGSPNHINNKRELPSDKLIDTASGASILSLQTNMLSLISNDIFPSLSDPLIAIVKRHAFIRNNKNIHTYPRTLYTPTLHSDDSQGDLIAYSGNATPDALPTTSHLSSITDGLHMDDAHGGGSYEEGYGYGNDNSHGLDGVWLLWCSIWWIFATASLPIKKDDIPPPQMNYNHYIHPMHTQSQHIQTQTVINNNNNISLTNSHNQLSLSQSKIPLNTNGLINISAADSMVEMDNIQTPQSQLSKTYNNNNNIKGNFEFVENNYSIYNLGEIGGHALFQSVNDVGKQSFDVSMFKIASVGGNLEFKCNSFGSFSENRVEVLGDIGGNVLLLDTSKGGHGFCCGANYWNFLGTIAGDVSVRDETIETSGGRTAYDTNFKMVRVNGNVEFIENGSWGTSFASTTYDIGYVGGNLLFETKKDFGTLNRQSFDVSQFTIGTVNGELSVLSTTFGAFSECVFNIDTVKVKASFIGTASAGYDFYSADININNCPNILIQADGTHNFYDSHNTFGVVNAANGGVGLVDIVINGGIHALHSTLFDAQYANELTLKCNNDADCTDVEINCPQDNKQNKCRVYCEPNANCGNIDLFTTNGYCLDASFNCVDSMNCQLNAYSQVFCTINSPYNYGQRATHCQMKRNTNTNGFYCQDVSIAQCSTRAVCGPTPEPTSSPTHRPTKVPTDRPTPIPTDRPTPEPTEQPTFKSCTDTTTPYNIEFIIDESGSVGHDNYKQSIDFVIDLIRNDVNANSKVAALSYATSNDVIYPFTNTQTDARSAVIASLNAEKDDYASQWTDTYNAMKGGIDLFAADSSITDNKVIILISDGVPKCASGDTDCIASVCGSDIVDLLSNNAIKVYIVGIGNFDSTELNCLVDDVNSDIKLMTDFSHQEFKRVETEFRDIFCPDQPPHAQEVYNIKYLPLTHVKDIDGNNNVHYNSNYKWLFANASMSVIATMFIIVLCYICYYYGYKKSNQKYSKVVVVNDDPESV